VRLTESYKNRLKVLSGLILENKWPHDNFLKKNNKYTYPKIPVQNIFSWPQQIIPRDKLRIADNYLNNNTFEQHSQLEDVDLSVLIPTQRVVTAQNLENAYNSKDIPYVIELNNSFYIIDGHHRFANAILDGQKTLKAFVLHEN
jgi:hypothetical protein